MQSQDQSVHDDRDASENLDRCYLESHCKLLPTCIVSNDEPVDVVTMPDKATASDEVVATWKALCDMGVVPDCESFCSYVSTDANMLTTEDLTENDVALVVIGRHETSEDEDVVDCDRSLSCTLNLPKSSQALDAVDSPCCYLSAREEGKDSLDIATAAERAVFPLREMQQHNITKLFGKSP